MNTRFKVKRRGRLLSSLSLANNIFCVCPRYVDLTLNDAPRMCVCVCVACLHLCVSRGVLECAWSGGACVTSRRDVLSLCVCVCVCARIVTDDINMITHHLSGDIATTDDVIGS